MGIRSVWEILADYPELDRELFLWAIGCLAQDGKLALSYPSWGEPWGEEAEIRAVAKQLDPQQWADLRGTEITLGEAVRLWGFPVSSLSRWVKAGHIKVLRTDGEHGGRSAYRYYLDAAEVAQIAALYRLIGRAGRRLFPPDSAKKS